MTQFFKKYKSAIFIAIPIIVLLIFSLNWLRLNPPQFFVDYLIKATIIQNRDKDLFKNDALYVITTGTGAPMPDATRVNPQTVVVAAGQILVFDAGPGSTRNIEISQIGVGEVDALFLTHYHSDHIGDIGELFLKRWGTEGMSAALPVYGPPGVVEVVNGFESAYQLDKGYRIAHHGSDDFPESGFGGEPIVFDLGEELTSSKVIYEEDGVTVIAFNVDHKPVFPAVGYRVSYKERSVVITGDTIYTESLVEHSRDADLLVSEVLNHDWSKLISSVTEDNNSNASIVAEDILDYHISPSQLGMLATKANVKQVLATHILPPVPVPFLENPFLYDLRKEFKGPTRMASDGTMAILSINSDKIIYKELIK